MVKIQVNVKDFQSTTCRNMGSGGRAPLIPRSGDEQLVKSRGHFIPGEKLLNITIK
jgi:hypothetical protein